MIRVLVFLSLLVACACRVEVQIGDGPDAGLPPQDSGFVIDSDIPDDATFLQNGDAGPPPDADSICDTGCASDAL